MDGCLENSVSATVLGWMIWDVVRGTGLWNVVCGWLKGESTRRTYLVLIEGSTHPPTGCDGSSVTGSMK